jgi:flagellar biosynthetic protein FlhB
MPLEDKTEAPTPRKREEAREEGQVCKSADLNSALVLVVGLYLIKLSIPNLGSRLKDIFITSFSSFSTHDITVNVVFHDLVRLLLYLLVAVAPIVLGVMLVGTLANVMQVGLHISSKSLQFKGSRLNPLPGIQRMFSANSGVELLKSVSKIGVVGFVVYTYIRQRAPELSYLMGMDFMQTCIIIADIAWNVLLRSSMVILIIGAADYIYQKIRFEKQLKMTKQEVKDDTKRSEGDPLVKGHIRQKQREMAQKRMMSEVPKADVVVTNPTHFAVALRYDSEVSDAPIVVAKGQRLVAQRIKAIAIENNIPIVENVPLARALFASVEVGMPIPGDLYQAVAEILAYVYRLTKRAA